jgi:hypothetical protein
MQDTFPTYWQVRGNCAYLADTIGWHENKP